MIAQFGNVQVRYRIESRGGLFGVVNPDYDQHWNIDDYPQNNYHVSRPTRNGVPYGIMSGNAPLGLGLPATARFVLPETVNFIESFQWYFHELNSARSGQSDEKNKASFKSLFRDNVMMCDYAGTWSRADYINGNGLPPYIVLKPMVTGGTLLKIVGELKMFGQMCWLVEGINLDCYQKFPHTTHTHLWFSPTISIRRWEFDTKGNPIKKEEHFSEPFDDYGGNTLLPVLGVWRDSRSETGWVNAIEKYRVRLLASSEDVPNPFIMRSGTKPNPYSK